MSAPRGATTASCSGCLRCGACCAAFRVSFYWAEADAVGLSPTLIEQIGPWYACMAGSNAASPRCRALDGEVGSDVQCTVYAQRPSPCREVQVGDIQCTEARRRYGLPAIVSTTTINEVCAPGKPDAPVM